MKRWQNILLLGFHLIMLTLFLGMILFGLQLRWCLGYLLFFGAALSGMAYIPSNESGPSPDKNVYVVTASFLSEEMQVRNTAHEGYGHAYFFELKQSDKSINPNHTYEAVGFEDVYDEEFNITYPVPIFGKSNHALENQITTVENQAVENNRNGKIN